VVFAGKTFIPVGYLPSTYGAPPYAAGYQGRPPPRYPEVDPGAHAWFVHPLAYHEHRALAEGTLPFWNRHNGFGWPMLSDGQIALFSPLHWIELINPDWPLLWDLHHFLLRFLAALFTCYLLSRLGASPAIAALGAPIAAVHGSFTAMVQRADLNAYALMPALLYCVVRLREERDARSTFALGAALYLVLTVGHPQPAVSVLLPCGLIAAGLSLWPRGAGAVRYLALAAIAGVLAILLSAPYWLPFLDNLKQSWTLHPPGIGSESAPPGRVLQWLVPGIFARSGRKAFLDSPATALTFLGGAAGTLAVLGVVAFFAVPAARRRAVWLAVPIPFALKIFGFPPVQWMGRLPLLEQMWFWYFSFAVLYLLALCGLLAIQDLLRAPARQRLVVHRVTAILVVGLLILSPAYEPPPWMFGGLSRYLLPLMAIYSAIALGTLLLAYLSAGRRGHLAIAALGAVLLLELTSYRYALPDRGNPTAVAPFVRWLQEQQRQGPPFRVMGLGDWLNPNMTSAFGLDDVRICDALVPPGQVPFIRRYLQKNLLFGWFLHASPQLEGFRIPAGIFNLLNVRYVIGFPNGIEDYIAKNRVAYADEAMSGGVIVENRSAWPRIFAVQQPHLEPSKEAALERLGSLDASAPFAVVADDFPRERWKELCGAGCGGAPLRQQVSDIRYGINDLSFRASVDGPAVLVVSDSLTAGWRATVDGVEQPIFRANYLFRGILLERGEHQVHFAYSQPGWRLSLWLAGAGLAACAAFALAVLVRRRWGSNVGVAPAAANLSD